MNFIEKIFRVRKLTQWGEAKFRFKYSGLIFEGIQNFLSLKGVEMQYIIRNFVECEVCGCLLNKETAFKGENTEEDAINSYHSELGRPCEKVIKENYFCKIHKPKGK